MPMPTDPVDTAPMSDSLRALARSGAQVRLRAGAQIIVEGDFGDAVYIVLSGRLCAYTLGADDDEIIYGEYGAGELVGEMGLDGGRRSANVRATLPTLCARVPRFVLERHLQLEPAFAMELLALVIRRARMATYGLQQMATADVYGRLKQFLEGIAQPQADGTRMIEPAPSHKSIAKHVRCAAGSVTRKLQGLEQRGFVRSEQLAPRRRRIVLLKALPAHL